MLRLKDLLPIAVSIVICQAAGAIGSLFTFQASIKLPITFRLASR